VLVLPQNPLDPSPDALPRRQRIWLWRANGEGRNRTGDTTIFSFLSRFRLFAASQLFPAN
jgi:hypothetical protein